MTNTRILTLVGVVVGLAAAAALGLQTPATAEVSGPSLAPHEVLLWGPQYAACGTLEGGQSCRDTFGRVCSATRVDLPKGAPGGWQWTPSPATAEHYSLPRLEAYGPSFTSVPPQPWTADYFNPWNGLW
jgi:hypothetical protein